ncbi:ethylene-responsive transcription factor 3-like protein [Tanacetum coccineum]
MYTQNNFACDSESDENYSHALFVNSMYPYIQQTIDVVGRCDISTLLKCTSEIRQLAYGAVPDSLDEYLQIGSNNDINVLRQSPLLNDLKEGKGREVPFVANSVNYKWGYYLTDGIIRNNKKKATSPKLFSEEQRREDDLVRSEEDREKAELTLMCQTSLVTLCGGTTTSLRASGVITP